MKHARAISGAILTSLVLLIGITCGGPVPLSTRYPIDGVVNFRGLAAQHRTITFRNIQPPYDTHHAAALTWAIQNDDRDVYIALEWDDDDNNNSYTLADGPVDNDFLYILIDNDRNGSHENGEDRKLLMTAHQGVHYIDGYRNNDDTPADIIGDGKGFIKYYPARKKYQAEFMFPLAADANGQDAALAAIMRYNVLLLDHYEPAGTGYMANLSDDWDVTAGWDEYEVKSAAPISRPALPDDLGGLIVFINKPDGTNGSIYTFNPADGTVSPRIQSANPADLDSLVIDGVSLSHDRTRIAFMGWTPGDIATAEVYTMNLDGTDFIRVTNNDGVDGHPAWSPDDDKLLYITYHDTARSHIITANADGSGAVDLTAVNGAPPDTEENDPEWLPDGRVLFKTSRWTPWSNPAYENELRVAVMNADGSEVRQISFGADVVDHDAMADSRSAVFERMTKPYDYALDVRSFFIPWDIVEAPLSGRGQKTLIHNVFVNWLPVFAPGGNYFVYIRSGGYSEARLATRRGADLGRFIPGYTWLQYLDWK